MPWDTYHEQWETAEPWCPVPVSDEVLLEEVCDEAYPPVAEVVREVYGAAGPPRLRRTGYRVTSHARVRCECGAMNYSEQIGRRPPALPERCWRCEEAL